MKPTPPPPKPAEEVVPGKPEIVYGPALGRLRKMIVDLMNGMANAADRQRFSKLLDVTNGAPLPTDHKYNGKGVLFTRRAVIYARILQALYLVREESNLGDVTAVTETAERLCCADAGTYRLIGDQATGFDVEFSKDE